MAASHSPTGEFLHIEALLHDSNDLSRAGDRIHDLAALSSTQRNVGSGAPGPAGDHPEKLPPSRMAQLLQVEKWDAAGLCPVCHGLRTNSGSRRIAANAAKQVFFQDGGRKVGLWAGRCRRV